MKIKCLLLVGLMCIGISGFGQDFRFGITANPSILWVKPDNTEISGDGVRFGFDFGLVVEYVFGAEGRYSVNSGLNLLLSGAKIMSADTSLNQTHEITARVKN